LKYTIMKKTADRRMNEIDATERTLTKFLMNVIALAPS
jgi:hypothetical protein